MKETFVFYKELDNYFITSLENYNSRIQNARKIINLRTNDRQEALDIVETNFKDCKILIVKE